MEVVSVAGSPFAWLALAWALTGCGPGKGPAHRLEGSLSVLMDLGYDIAYVDATPEEVAVRFTRKRGEGEDLPFKVTANLANVALEPGVELNLSEELSPDVQRGVATRNVLDDPRQTFPKLRGGRLILKGLVETGRKVPGEVSITFDNGTDLASGRTVFGTFEGVVP